MADRIDRAAWEIAADVDSTDPTIRELAKSQRLLAKAALVKAKGYDREDDEDEDEIDAQQEDDHDEYDEEEDEDQDPDNPDLGSGVDDLRGVVGSPKKHRRAYAEKSKRRRAEEAEDALVRAKLRLKKAERAERDAEEDGDDERLEEARKSRKAAERELHRARGKLRRARPAWAGDEEDFEAEGRRRRDDFEDVYAEGEDSYYTNEDADHEEDEVVPPDGPAVADGDDTDVYTIGAHKVRSQRAMRRSRQGLRTKQDLYKSVAEHGRITEDALDAAPALEELLDILGEQQELLAKSVRGLSRTDRVVRALAEVAVTQNRAIASLKKSVDAVLAQPVTGPMPGLLPSFNVLAGGKDRSKGRKLQKSRQDLLLDAEDALNRGLIDTETFQALGRVGTVDEMVNLMPAPVRQQLGWQ